MHFVDDSFYIKNFVDKIACVKIVGWKNVNFALNIDAYFLNSSIPLESNA